MELEAPARVTRLRQRLSLEQAEEVSSPATPTKKRASKLVKPHLDNIAENAVVNSPRRATRRSIAQEAIDPVEEKILTPGKRGARLISNSSILSATTQAFESPRAKRVTRRNSLAGSDNEASVDTPVRRSRRISKDFIGSPDTQVEPKSITKRSKKGTEVKTIEEESNAASVITMNTSQGSDKTSSLSNASQSTVSKESYSVLNVLGESSDLDKSSSNVRKSPRLSLKKTSRSSISEDNNHDNFSKQKMYSESFSVEENVKMEPKLFVTAEQINKSYPAIRDKNHSKKRLRTKSLTNLDKHYDVDSSSTFFSDNESQKSKMHKNQKYIAGLEKLSQSPRLSLKKTSRSSISEDNKHDDFSKQKINSESCSVEENIKMEPKLFASAEKINKSYPAIRDKNHSKERLRTKSLSNLDKHFAVDSSSTFFSDNESQKSKMHKKQKPIAALEKLSQSHGIGDYEKDKSANSSKLNTTPLQMEDNKENEVDVNLSRISSNQLHADLGAQNKNKLTKSLLSISGIDVLDVSTQQSAIEVVTESYKEEKKENLNKSRNGSSCPLPLDCENESEIQATIYFDESDTSSIDSELNSRHKEVNRNNSFMKKQETKKKNISKNEKSIVNEIETKPKLKDSSNNCESLLKSPISEIKESPKIGKNEKRQSLTKNPNNFSLSNKVTDKVETPNNINSMDVLDNSSGFVWIGKKNRQETDRSCEPMDIDETIPENVTLIDSSADSVSKLKQKLNKSMNRTFNSQPNTSLLNNSKHVQSHVDTSAIPSEEKGKCSYESSPELEKSNLASKSTIVLSVNNIDKSSEISRRSFKSDTPMSRSHDVNMNKESDKKNHSFNGIGVTPLANKTLKTSGVFTSTPVNLQSIVPSNENSITQSKNELSQSSSKLVKSRNSSKHDSSEEDNTSDILDDEAEDVGKEYQSGDSQDEDEKVYLKQNEIREKGETLDSDEDEGSNDSDYEKDSFVVSSDEELLTGSGDNLSDGDNELNMTAKSKMKYNIRKMKEQKQASKEMFESRHAENNKLSDTEGSTDTEIIITSKNRKRNRLRLDSSKDTTKDEKEMSVLDNSVLNEKDPLSTTLIKQEPAEQTTTDNTILEEIENVEIDQNITIFANKDTCNPLMSNVELDENDSQSESSDDGKIANNYDSLLKHLNDSKNYILQGGNKERKNKTLDASNDKNESNDSIFGTLNLTQTKRPKIEKGTKSATFDLVDHDKESIHDAEQIETLDIGKDKSTDEKNELQTKNHHPFLEYETSKKNKDNSLLDKLNITKSEKDIKNIIDSVKNKMIEKPVQPDEQDESSSDAIDFQLLFSQDETSNDTQDFNESSTKVKQAVEDFIPLKKSEAKTNLVELQSEQFAKLDEKEDHDGGGDILHVKAQDDVDNNTSGKRKKKKKNRNDSVTAKDIELVEQTDSHENIAVIMPPKSKVDSKSAKKNTKKNHSEIDIQGNIELNFQQTKSNKKRKRDDADTNTTKKVYQTSVGNSTIVRRLPASILEQLDHGPKEELESSVTKPSAISTSAFHVEVAKRRLNKPSSYLEESIHIDAKSMLSSKRASVKTARKHKTMQSVPTASTSIAGFTTNFKVNVLTENKRLDAKLSFETTQLTNFKTEWLYGSRIKRIATEELCRKQKKIKTSKF